MRTLSMGTRIRKAGSALKKRWLAKMPRFFKRMMIVCASIVCTAIGINTMLSVAGATPHAWWNDIYPLLIGVPTGMAIVCKLTVGGGKDVDPEKFLDGNPMKKDSPHP